jgi:hypothetical protein
MLAASWTFHQQLNGLNVEEGIPLEAIPVKKSSMYRSSSHED